MTTATILSDGVQLDLLALGRRYELEDEINASLDARRAARPANRARSIKSAATRHAMRVGIFRGEKA